MSSTSPALRAGSGSFSGRGLTVAQATRPHLRLVAFAALVLLGATRWGTLLAPRASGRLVAMASLAFILAALGPWLAARSRVLAVLAAVAVAVAMLALAGLPFTWIRHVRVARSAHAIGHGLGALPALLVPYRGADRWVRMVILLGAAVLLLDAALMMAFALPPAGRRGAGAHAGRPGAGQSAAGAGDLRRAIAGLPLVALAGVPLTLVPARFPYVQGLFVFVLLAALVWGERLPRGGAWGGVSVCGLALLTAMILAPAIDRHRPLIHYQTIVIVGAGGGSEIFNWDQTYSQLRWPREGRAVLAVKAARPDYWKAESLDLFGPFGWETGQVDPSVDTAGVSAASRRQWTQSIHVTVEAMKTSLIIGAGEFASPTHASQIVATGPVTGTYYVPNQMGQGDSYDVATYSPRPSRAQLAHASAGLSPGGGYPAAVLNTELTLTVPEPGGAEREVVVPPFGTEPNGYRAPGVPKALRRQWPRGPNVARELARSPYAPAYALAQRLRRGARTPYAYARRVMAYLAKGFVYDENPPPSAYPILSFLFASHRGYCQQFAGAMALLLRLGGVPARVAVGFTTGQPDAATREYVVSDYDAHAWVETFFPGYGWVRFDPTPATDPALQRQANAGLLPNLPNQSAPEPNSLTRHGLQTPGQAAAAAAARAHRHRPRTSLALPLAILAVALLLTLAGLRFGLRPHRTGDELLDELERAFTRTGRRLPAGMTLVELERRLHDTPAAAAYVRAIREARYGLAPAAATAAGDVAGARGAGGAGGNEIAPGVATGIRAAEVRRAPARAQMRTGRRALRAHLRSGLGPTGGLRALWALPPRRPHLPRRRPRLSGS